MTEIDVAAFMKESKERTNQLLQDAKQVVDAAYILEIKRPKGSIDSKIDDVIYVQPWTTACGRIQGIRATVLDLDERFGAFNWLHSVTQKDTLYINGSQISANDLLSRYSRYGEGFINIVIVETYSRAQNKRKPLLKGFVFAVAISLLLSAIFGIAIKL